MNIKKPLTKGQVLAQLQIGNITAKEKEKYTARDIENIKKYKTVLR